MRILAFETSAKAASVALLQDSVLLAEVYQNNGMTHSATIMKMASDLLASCGLTAKDLDAVSCARGPGSFTGVRIGVAAAKGFAWGAELPCFGISTLAAMAQCVSHMEGLICCTMDARREQVYNALFVSEHGVVRRITEDRAISLPELEQDLKSVEKQKILVGDGAQLCYNTFGQKLESLILMPEHLRMQRAYGVAILGQEQFARGERPSGIDLTPNYLRLSQAERERLKKSETIREEK